MAVLHHFQYDDEVKPLIEINGSTYPIEGLYISIRGVKNGSTVMPTDEVEVELYQTNSKREKAEEKIPPPQPITVASSVTIPRLHFRKATSNNARKHKMPNPQQEFFRLVLTISARYAGRDYCVSSVISDPLIVRTGHPATTSSTATPSTPLSSHPSSPPLGYMNEPDQDLTPPGQTYTSPISSPNQNGPRVTPGGGQMLEMGMCAPSSTLTSAEENGWGQGQQGALYHYGNVGVNTETPTESLTVHGNIAVTGIMYQPSDMRVKTDIHPTDTAAQLGAINNLRIYDYKLTEQWAESTGVTERQDRGVLAQELQQVIPSAVKTTGDRQLADGTVIKEFLMVNKDAIFMDNVGATQELSKKIENVYIELDILDNKKIQVLGDKVGELERKTKREIEKNEKRKKIFIIVGIVTVLLILALVALSAILGVLKSKDPVGITYGPMTGPGNQGADSSDSCDTGCPSQTSTTSQNPTTTPQQHPTTSTTVLEGLLNYRRLQPNDTRWVVATGVSAGSLNAAFLSMYDVGQEQLAHSKMKTVWLSIQKSNVLKDWVPAGILQGALFESGIYDGSPRIELIDRYINVTMIKSSTRALSVGATNLDTGMFELFTEDDEELDLGIKGSGAIPFLVAPIVKNGYSYADGALVSNTPITEAMRRCYATGATEVIIDVVFAATPKDKFVNVANMKSLEILARSQEIMDQNNDIPSALNAYPDAKLNLYVPSKRLPGGFAVKSYE
eukprot:gene15479-18382_t